MHTNTQQHRHVLNMHTNEQASPHHGKIGNVGKVLEEERWQQRREGNSECGDGHGCEEGSQGERGGGGSAMAWALVDLKTHLGQGSLSSESPALQTLKSLPRLDRGLGSGGGGLERGEQLRTGWGTAEKRAGGWKEGRVGDAEVSDWERLGQRCRSAIGTHLPGVTF